MAINKVGIVSLQGVPNPKTSGRQSSGPAAFRKSNEPSGYVVFSSYTGSLAKTFRTLEAALKWADKKGISLLDGKTRKKLTGTTWPSSGDTPSRL